MGGRIVAPALADEILGVWLATLFEGGRHQRRIDQIAELEREAAGARPALAAPLDEPLNARRGCRRLDLLESP